MKKSIATIKCTSLDRINHVLTRKNRALLRLIDKEKPRSIYELSEISGRDQGNLYKTLRKLEAVGVLGFEKEKNRLIPYVKTYKLFIEFDLRE